MKKFHSLMSPQATANFGLVLVVLIFTCVVVHRNTVALQSAENRITHTYEVFNKADLMFLSLTDAEAAIRGYLLTGDPRMMQEYRRQTSRVDEDARELRALVGDNPSQKSRVEHCLRQMNQELMRMQSLVELFHENGLAAAQARLVEEGGAEGMQPVRQAIKEMQQEEEALLVSRRKEQDYRLFVVLAANLTAVIVNIAIMASAWYLVERELSKRRTAEETAQSERQNLWVTLSSIGDGVIVVDENGKIKLANPIALELMGNSEEVIGRPFSELFRVVDESSHESLPNPVDAVLAQGRITQNVHKTALARPDGRWIPIEQTAAPIRSSRGAIKGVVFVFRDCTQRRQIEREMLDREQRFRRVFESPQIGIGIATAEGTLVDANDVYLDLIGTGRGSIGVGALSWDGKPSGVSPFDHGTRQELRESGTCKPIERTYTRTDGNRVPVLISAARLMDDLDRVVIFVTDLSQSKRAEAALRESEARFRVLSECMPQKVWTAAPDGRFEYLNNMFLEYTGQTSDRLTGWSWTNVIHPDDLEAHLAAWNQSITSGNMFEIEHRVRKHTGEYRWHLARALPVYKPTGEIAMWVGTNTDIHDQKQAEETLREEHRRKDQFLALLAHELRNPLAPLSNAIIAFPHVMKHEENSQALLGIMQRQVRQMTRLIDDLLDLARITTGRMRLQCEPIVVSNIVSAAVEGIQPLVNERNHQLTVEVPDDELWLDADATRIAQVLTNLLHNAAKYTAPGGQLTLAVQSSADHVAFVVRDNGPGISAEMLSRIFDLFMQVELTLNRSHGGLGIGLTLVRTLVELHGGTVAASSPGLNLGSEFVVRLPRQPPPASTSRDGEVAETAPVVLPKLQVLVVDDVQASAKTLALMLQALGQEASIEFDGLSAIAKVTSSSFDLVFLDIAMPGMDGLEVARKIRSIESLRPLTLVALTGFGQEEDRMHSLQAGFDEHITKPTSLDILKEILARAAKARYSPVQPE